MKFTTLIFLLIFLLSSVSITALNINQEIDTTQVLLIYTNSTDQNSVIFSLQDTSIPINTVSRQISNLESTNFQSYDLIILVSSSEFNLEEEDENKLNTFLNDPSKYFIIFSPFLDEFEDTTESLLGLEDIGDTFPEDNITNWDLRLDATLGNLTQSSTYTYFGQYTELEPLSSATTLVTITNAELTDDMDGEISFPIPAVINATTNKAHIITSSLSPFSTASNDILSLNQIPQIFDLLFEEIMLSNINIISQTSGNIVSDPTGTDKPDEDSPLDNIPILPDLKFGNFLIYGILVMISLFITKILGILDWLSRKIIGVSIFIVGAFYSVEDRILDQKDVYLNQSRADIMDFLDAVGKYGSHLREIKSITNLGSGSLMWHLKVLEDFNWIVKYKIENYTVYVSYNFETTFDPYVKGLELKLQSKYTYDLIHALLSINFDTNIFISDLQDLTSIPNKAIRRFINKLAELDLVKISSQKPIQFRIYNYSILNNLNESFQIRKYYEIPDNGVQVDEID